MKSTLRRLLRHKGWLQYRTLLKGYKKHLLSNKGKKEKKSYITFCISATTISGLSGIPCSRNAWSKWIVNNTFDLKLNFSKNKWQAHETDDYQRFMGKLYQTSHIIYAQVTGNGMLIDNEKRRKKISLIHSSCKNCKCLSRKQASHGGRGRSSQLMQVSEVEA